MLLNDKLNRKTRISIAASATGVMGLCGLVFAFSQIGQIIAAENSKAQNESAKAGPASGQQSDLPPLQSDLTFQVLQALQQGGGGGGGFGGAGGQGGIFDSRGVFVPGTRALPIFKVSTGGTQIGPTVDITYTNIGEGGVPALEVERAWGMLPNMPSTRTAFTPQSDEERRKAAQLREQVFASLLETMKNETNSELRIIAMNSLVRMQPGGVIEPLVEIVVKKDANHQMRIQALSALAGQPGTACTEALLKLYDELEEVDLKTAILQMLGSRRPRDLTGDNLATTEKWIAKLQQIAKESPSRELKVEAIRQLGRVGENLQEPPREK